MHITIRKLLPAALLAVSAAPALGQGLPTTQPNLIQIVREEVKIGHEAAHRKTEAGWPAAFEKAKDPEYYMAMVSMTGPAEAWFVIPLDSHKAMGDMLKRQNDNPALSTELDRLSLADAENINSLRVIHAAARKDLSRGSFPDMAQQRYWEITLFRMKPGHEADFEAAAKAYGAAAGRSAPNTSYRVYEIIAGMPGPTYLVFTSVVSFSDFDSMMTDGEATMKGMTAEERAALQKFSADGLIEAETNRFRLDPEMSYVPSDVRTKDPTFWAPKKPSH
jgi:hypothetical protein